MESGWTSELVALWFWKLGMLIFGLKEHSACKTFHMVLQGSFTMYYRIRMIYWPSTVFTHLKKHDSIDQAFVLSAFCISVRQPRAAARYVVFPSLQGCSFPSPLLFSGYLLPKQTPVGYFCTCSRLLRFDLGQQPVRAKQKLRSARDKPFADHMGPYSISHSPGPYVTWPSPLPSEGIRRTRFACPCLFP